MIGVLLCPIQAFRPLNVPVLLNYSRVLKATNGYSKTASLILWCRCILKLKYKKTNRLGEEKKRREFRGIAPKFYSPKGQPKSTVSEFGSQAFLRKILVVPIGLIFLIIIRELSVVTLCWSTREVRFIHLIKW